MSQFDKQAVVYKLLTDAGVSFSLDSFDNRLKLQKAAYLLVAMGAPLDYHYNWYLRGPYSPSLAKDLFGIASHIESTRKQAEGLRFGRGGRQHIDALKNALRAKPRDYQTETIWFEALASVAYLKKRGADKPAIEKQLQEEKSLSAKMVSEAYRVIADLGL